MFVCAACLTSVGPYVQPKKIVIKTRNRTYVPRPLANDPGGVGTEIVSEVNVCPSCVEKKGR